MQAEVLILLATYNGGQYLPDQLQSIENQTYPHWQVVACDDGSSDDTVEILERFRLRHPGRVKLMHLPPSGSAKANFFQLLRSAPFSRYVACCDQDDVWESVKLERLVNACQRLESRVGGERPCLVYSDLRVVDAGLRTIADSFMEEIDTDPTRVTFGSILVENSIPGCSMVFNMALLQEFQRFQGSLVDARMHDWWLALIGFSTGAVEYVPEQLVLYRQHPGNSAGSVSRRGFAFAARKLLRPGRDESTATIRQGRLFFQAHGSRVLPPKLEQLDAFSELEGLGKMTRVATCIRLRILKQGARRRAYQLLRI
jgi:glycosyltransferase involved in cell wall biosynthesis